MRSRDFCGELSALPSSTACSLGQLCCAAAVAAAASAWCRRRRTTRSSISSAGGGRSDCALMAAPHLHRQAPVACRRPFRWRLPAARASREGVAAVRQARRGVGIVSLEVLRRCSAVRVRVWDQKPPPCTRHFLVHRTGTSLFPRRVARFLCGLRPPPRAAAVRRGHGGRSRGGASRGSGRSLPALLCPLLLVPLLAVSDDDIALQRAQVLWQSTCAHARARTETRRAHISDMIPLAVQAAAAAGPVAVRGAGNANASKHQLLLPAPSRAIRRLRGVCLRTGASRGTRVCRASASHSDDLKGTAVGSAEGVRDSVNGSSNGNHGSNGVGQLSGVGKETAVEASLFRASEAALEFSSEEIEHMLVKKVRAAMI